MKKGFCQNCGCRFTFKDSEIKEEEDLWGKKTHNHFVKCPVCELKVYEKHWVEVKSK